MPNVPKVVKLAQPGFDVHTAGDENLIYNSNWPLLKIYKQGSWTTSDKATGHQIIVDHNLGYVPAFWAFSNSTDVSWQTDVASPAERSEFNGQFEFEPAATRSQLIFDINPGFLNGTVKLYYYIFALDMTKPYQAPSIKAGGQAGATSGDKVFKIAKDGKDISSHNLEDYVIHSDARSPLVHSVYQGVTAKDATVQGGIGYTYYHNLGYIPMVFAYGKGDVFGGFTKDSWLQLATDSASSYGFIIDEKKIQYFSAQEGVSVNLLILKDPFTVDYSVDVNI